ncbi:MAG TPA: hypothetical protein VJR89_14005, partial [Polyangiales bacterium]|nr:hypothetical protein [Polyangiales bacterium]
LERVLEAMQRTDSTHLLLVDAGLAQRLAMDGRLRPLFALGRYTLLERAGAVAQPIAAGPGVRLLGSERSTPGRMELRLEVAARGGRAQLRESYSPFWRLSPAGAGELYAEPDGLMSIRDLPAGAHTLRLEVALPRLPGWLTYFGWACIVTACWLGGARRVQIGERDSVMADREGRGVALGRGAPKAGSLPFRGAPRTSEAP